MQTFTGKEEIMSFNVLTLKLALKIYGIYKIRAHRKLTPKLMLEAATRATGVEYKFGDYLKAAEDLQIWLDERHA